MNEGLGVQDKNGILTFMNRRACEELGYKPEELIGKPTTILFDKENQKILKEQLVKRRKGGHQNYEIKWLRKDGTTIDTIISPTPFFDANGDYAGSMAVYTDITELKKIEKKLFEEEKKYHNLVDLMNEGVGVQDKNGILTFLNRRACEVLGYKREELIGKSINLLLDKTDQTNFAKRMEERRRGGSRSYELNWTRKDGTQVNTMVSPSPILDENGKYAGSVAVITDITDRKKAEEEREQFLKFFNLSSDIMVIADPKGSFKRLNPTALKVFGYSESELVSKSFVDFVYEDDKQNTIDEMVRQIKIGSSFDFKNRYVCKDGKVIWLSWRATYDKNDKITYATARDITAEKEYVEKIKKEQLKSTVLAKDLEKFKLAVDGTSEHVIITDVEGIVLYLNKAAEIITGYTYEEAVGQKAGKIWGGHMPKEFYEKMWHTIKTEKKPFIGEMVNRRKSGETYEVALRIAPILNKAGQVDFFVGIERDITEAKEIDRMKADFMSFTSHQLRTPLTVIKWNTEMIQSGDAGKLTKEQKRYLREIERGEKRMAQLINSLLNISRLESSKIKIEPKPTDIVPYISSIISELTPFVSAKNCIIKFNKPKKSPSINLDPTLFKQVLLNLLNNAAHYSKPGKCEIDVDLKEVEEYYQIDVTDQGIGIPISVQDKIFSKFFRADNAVKADTEGTGLGLYMTKLIIEASGGKVWFESVEGKGSVFHFTVPKSGMRKVVGEKSLSA